MKLLLNCTLISSILNYPDIVLPPVVSMNGNNKVDMQQQTGFNEMTTDEDTDSWHLVGTFKGTNADIKHYYVVPSKLNLENYVRKIFSRTTHRISSIHPISRNLKLYKSII